MMGRGSYIPVLHRHSYLRFQRFISSCQLKALSAALRAEVGEVRLVGG